MNLRKQRAAAMAKAQEYNAKVKAGATLSEEEVSSVKSLLAEIASLDEQISKADDAAEVVAQIGALGGGSDGQPTENNGGEKARSLGDHFMKSLNAAGRSLKDQGTFNAPEFKASNNTHVVGGSDDAYGPLVTDVDRNFIQPYRRPLVVADLLGVGPIEGNAIKYPVFGQLEGTTGIVASEGGLKPQVHVADPTWVTDGLYEIAGHFKVSDTMLEDLPYLVSEINSTLLYDLQTNEEAGLLYGAGFRGLLERSGVQVLVKGKDSDPDRIFTGMTNVQDVSGFAADGIIINPVDYAKIRLSKDANGQYFGGGFFAGQYGNGGISEQPPLWGLRTVVTSAIKPGEVLVGAFKASSKVFRKGGVRVESTNSHGEDFVNDLVTIRIRERLGLQVKYPAALCKVELGVSA